MVRSLFSPVTCALLWGHHYPYALLLRTYPFADQVVSEVGGQHVRAECLFHVLTINLEV